MAVMTYRDALNQALREEMVRDPDVFLMGEDGDTFVIRAGPEFELLHTNTLNEMALATPAVVRGSLLLRTQTKLYRISTDSVR